MEAEVRAVDADGHESDVSDEDTIAADEDADGSCSELLTDDRNLEDEFPEDLIPHDPQDQDAASTDTVVPRPPSSGSSSSSRRSDHVVKVSVSVNDRSQLLELPLLLSLEEVCRQLCAAHRIRWWQGRLALQWRVARVAGGGYRFLTELNRHQVPNGAELRLVYSPAVQTDHLALKLADRSNEAEWSWALQRLAELAPDPVFLKVFAERARATVDLVLQCLVSERRGERLRGPRHNRQLQWALRVVLCLLRCGALDTLEPPLLRRLAGLVRAEHTVNAGVLEASLLLLTAVSTQPWDVSVVAHLGVTDLVRDLVPLLWERDKPAIQAAALELLNTLAAREIRLGPASPEGKLQIVKEVTSPQVRASILQNVLCGPVRADMARQLVLLQALMLQPLKEALSQPAHSQYQPPPERPRRRSLAERRRGTSTTSLPYSRSSWAEESAAAGEDSSLRGSVASLASLASDSHRSSLASIESEEFVEEAPPLSQLGLDCLQYLAAHYPTLAVRSKQEEGLMAATISRQPIFLRLAQNLRTDALHGSLPATAERLVRLLGAELFDTKRRAPYQPLAFTPDLPFLYELFCRGLNLLAKTRREMRAKTARDQDKVLRVVRRQFREALAAQVCSWERLDDWLNALPYSAVAALWEQERLAAEKGSVFESAGVQQLRTARRPVLMQLVRQQRVAGLRAGARFQRTLHHQKKRSFVWVWLAPGDATLQYVDCRGDERGLLGELGESRRSPLSLPLASVTGVLTGRRRAHARGNSRARKHGDDPLALSLVLDPHDCEDPTLDLIAPDVATLETWTDGLNLLLGKEIQTASLKRDVEQLLDMEVRLQLMELDGVALPSEPPPLPPPPPDMNFATA